MCHAFENMSLKHWRHPLAVESAEPPYDPIEELTHLFPGAVAGLSPTG